MYKNSPSLGRKSGLLSPGSPAARRKSSSSADVDVLFFGVAGEKNSHVVLRFDFRARDVTLREADKVWALLGDRFPFFF